jgi:hypothetical protein
MFKLLSVLILFLFVAATTVAPYGSAKIAVQVLQDGPNEQTAFGQAFEEEIHHNQVCSFFVQSHYFDLTFPTHLHMTPQIASIPVLKPPLA